jgi:hypothetical protein
MVNRSEIKKMAKKTEIFYTKKPRQKAGFYIRMG